MANKPRGAARSCRTAVEAEDSDLGSGRQALCIRRPRIQTRPLIQRGNVTILYWTLDCTYVEPDAQPLAKAEVRLPPAPKGHKEIGPGIERKTI